MKKIHLMLIVFSAIALILGSGCSASGSKEMVDIGAKPIPSNTPISLKINFGELLNEVGLEDKSSIAKKMLTELIKEAEESDYRSDPYELPMMKLWNDFSSTGLDSKNPVHLWLLPTIKETKGGKGGSDSYLHVKIGISTSIKDSAQAEKKLQELFEKPLPWIQQKDYKALIASDEASGYRAPDGSRQSVAIGLSSTTLIAIIQAPLEGNGPDPERLVRQWIQKEEEGELETAARENHRAELLKMLDESMNTRSKPKGSIGTYLSTSNDIGAYLSLEKVTDELLPMMFEGSGIPIDWEKDEKEPQEFGLSIKSIKQSHARFSMNSIPGGLSIAGQLSNPTITSDWVGKGIDQKMLNAIPRDAAVIGSLSLGKKILNKTFLKETLPGTLREISPDIYYMYDKILEAIEDMEEEDTGWKMDELISIIEGTVFIAISPKETAEDQNEEEDEDSSTENVIIGIKISNPTLFTEVYGALKARGLLKELRQEKGLSLVNKGNYVYLCPRKFKEQLERSGKLSKPLVAKLQKDFLGETAILWTNLKVASKLDNFKGGPWNSNDKMDQALTAITKTMFFALKISEGKAAAEVKLGMNDGKTSGLRQLSNAMIKSNANEGDENTSERPWSESRGFTIPFGERGRSRR